MDVFTVPGRGNIALVGEGSFRPEAGRDVRRVRDGRVLGIYAVECEGRGATYRLVLGGQDPLEIGDELERVEDADEPVGLRELCAAQQVRIMRLEKAMVVLLLGLGCVPESVAGCLRAGLHCVPRVCQSLDGSLFLRVEAEPAVPAKGGPGAASTGGAEEKCGG